MHSNGRAALSLPDMDCVYALTSKIIFVGVTFRGNHHFTQGHPSFLCSFNEIVAFFIRQKVWNFSKENNTTK